MARTMHEKKCVQCGDRFLSYRRNKKCCSRECLCSLLSQNTSDPHYRARCREAAKARWSDPHYRSKMLTPEHRALRSQNAKARWSDPHFRARCSEAIKALWCDPRYRAKVSKANRERCKVLWSDPIYAAKTIKAIREAARQPEHRARMSKVLKKLWRDRDYTVRQIELLRQAVRDPKHGGKISKGIRDAWDFKKVCHGYLKKITTPERFEHIMAELNEHNNRIYAAYQYMQHCTKEDLLVLALERVTTHKE